MTAQTFKISFSRGSVTLTQTRTMAGHEARADELDALEALRKKHAPTHWGSTDDWYLAERNAIEALMADHWQRECAAVARSESRYGA